MSETSFGEQFPIPVRVLFLGCCAVIGWTVDVHVLTWLGIDTGKVLDLSLDDLGPPPHSISHTNAHGSTLYKPLYTLSLGLFAYSAGGYFLASYLRMHGGLDHGRGLLGVWIALLVLWLFVIPGRRSFFSQWKEERLKFKRCMSRIVAPLKLLPPSPIYFCDILFADFLTSLAKASGDLYTSSCEIVWGFGSGPDGEICKQGYLGPLFVSVPSLLRFRQCLSEVVFGSTPTPKKSIANAIKYGTALPVIWSSWLMSLPQYRASFVDDDTPHRSYIFWFWVCSVLVNSLYSFWWDITNDWGLSLLTISGWTNTSNNHLAVPGQPTVIFPPPSSRQPSPNISPPPSPKLGPSQNGNGHKRAYSTAATPKQSPPFLRPILLLPDPSIYYLAILIDLMLRLTWSLKLSNHLYNTPLLEEGVFIIELLEVVRRTVWGVLRMEWEAVRKGMGGVIHQERDHAPPNGKEKDLEEDKIRLERKSRFEGDFENNQGIELVVLEPDTENR